MGEDVGENDPQNIATRSLRNAIRPKRPEDSLKQRYRAVSHVEPSIGAKLSATESSNTLGWVPHTIPLGHYQTREIRKLRARNISPVGKELDPTIEHDVADGPLQTAPRRTGNDRRSVDISGRQRPGAVTNSYKLAYIACSEHWGRFLGPLIHVIVLAPRNTFDPDAFLDIDVLDPRTSEIGSGNPSLQFEILFYFYDKTSGFRMVYDASKYCTPFLPK